MFENNDKTRMQCNLAVECIWIQHVMKAWVPKHIRQKKYILSWVYLSKREVCENRSITMIKIFQAEWKHDVQSMCLWNLFLVFSFWMMQGKTHGYYISLHPWVLPWNYGKCHYMAKPIPHDFCHHVWLLPCIMGFPIGYPITPQTRGDRRRNTLVCLICKTVH